MTSASPTMTLEAAQEALFHSIALLKVPTDNFPTHSSEEQEDCEASCFRFLARQHAIEPTFRHRLQTRGLINEFGDVLLLRELHISYLSKGMEGLSGGFACLDSSRPWLVYWMLHGLALLDARPVTLFPRIIDFLSRCENKTTGGFGGGPSQLSHLAPTYAAVLALCTIGTQEAFAVPHRGRMYRWMMSLKASGGGVHIHQGGEIDIRSIYLMVAVAKILNILTPELASGLSEYALACQTFEGGFGGEPGSEAHGGYAFNALAALTILDAIHLCDRDRAIRWLVNRQMRLEGGFQGRINKLVDGCYSFWQGGAMVLLSNSIARDGTSSPPIFDSTALQRYILYCCQQEEGGLRDKPSKSRDYYHSCYCLSGLSIAQHHHSVKLNNIVNQTDETHTSESSDPIIVVGPSDVNTLQPTDPCMNVCTNLLSNAIAYYKDLPHSHDELISL